MPEVRQRFDEEVDHQYWLDDNLVGETMRRVATSPDGAWVALRGPRAWSFCLLRRSRQHLYRDGIPAASSPALVQGASALKLGVS